MWVWRARKLFLAVVILALVLVGILIWERGFPDNLAGQQNFHASMYYFDNKDFFPASVKSFDQVKPLASPPRVFIVNQHILAAHIIARQFALSADPEVTTVVLITQNNWNVGQAPIITSQYAWKTPLGEIEPDTALANQLIKNRLVVDEEDIFVTEHGIIGVVPYVARYFPNAKIVPLVIRDYTPAATIDSLAAQLSKLDLTHTAIVGTIDMSHYLPKYIADIHDELTLETIQEFDYATLPRLDIDTVPTLRTLMKVAQSHGLQSFVQTGHDNSATITNNPDLLSTTSYLSGYFAPGQPPKLGSGTASLLFLSEAQKREIDSSSGNIGRLFLGTHAVIEVPGGIPATSTTLSIPGRNICLVGNRDVAGEIKKISRRCSEIIVWDHGPRNLAHQFIDAGADLVIGTSPYGVQPLEIYNRKPIFYFPEGLALHLQLGTTTATFTLVDPKNLLFGNIGSAILGKSQFLYHGTTTHK